MTLNIPIWGIILIITLLLLAWRLVTLKSGGDYDFYTPMVALISVAGFVCFWVAWILSKLF
jgi:uncharacterized membrane protein